MQAEEAETESRSGLTEDLSKGAGATGIPAEPVDHRIVDPIWNPAT